MKTININLMREALEFRFELEMSKDPWSFITRLELELLLGYEPNEVYRDFYLQSIGWDDWTFYNVSSDMKDVLRKYGREDFFFIP